MPLARSVSFQALSPSLSVAVPQDVPRRQVTHQPITFMRPERFSPTLAPSTQKMPEFDAQAREQAKKSVAPAPTPEKSLFPIIEEPTDQKPAAQLEDLLARKYEEFSSGLERRLELFYEQTASRLDVLSEGIIHQFCETLNQQMTEALNTLIADRAEHNRALVDAECHAALDRFAARLDKVSLGHLEGHRKQIQLLSVNLKTRLRGVAHALEELGPHYRS